MPANRRLLRRASLAAALTPCLAIPLLGGAPAGGPGDGREAAVPGTVVDTTVPRPDLYRIALGPTAVGSGASGVAKLRLAPSPFGIALSPDGHFLFDVELTVTGLPKPSSWGPYSSYVAWATTENLDIARRLGEVTGGKPITARVDYHKFILLVTAEADAEGDHWQGPVVLRGLSASMFLDNFSGKTFFNNGVPE